MHCPFCEATDTEVYNSRASGHYRIWRRRRCSSCKHSFTTYEFIDLSYLKVMVPGGAYSSYKRYKLFNSIYSACEGVKQRTEAVDGLTNTVETHLIALQTETVATAQIVEIVLESLKAFNLSAFMRYLAVHSDIATISDLKSKLKN